ncbi:MAG: hypothetical protein JNL17_13390 [Cyclobacteriaceae bacterium]|nr:hypothetical protein [Cyclobacteriaceae bacterium]
MTTHILSILTSFFCLLAGTALPQAPQSFKYQAIARNNADALVANQEIRVQISIRDLTPMGTVVYREQHSATTNGLGLFTISVGGGTKVGNNLFSSIAWGMGDKFLEVEVDFSGSNTFVSLGTSQLLSVPYALLAESTRSPEWKNIEPPDGWGVIEPCQCRRNGDWIEFRGILDRPAFLNDFVVNIPNECKLRSADLNLARYTTINFLTVNNDDVHQIETFMIKLSNSRVFMYGSILTRARVSVIFFNGVKFRVD